MRGKFHLNLAKKKQPWFRQKVKKYKQVIKIRHPGVLNCETFDFENDWVFTGSFTDAF